MFFKNLLKLGKPRKEELLLYLLLKNGIKEFSEDEAGEKIIPIIEGYGINENNLGSLYSRLLKSGYFYSPRPKGIFLVYRITEEGNNRFESLQRQIEKIK